MIDRKSEPVLLYQSSWSHGQKDTLMTQPSAGQDVGSTVKDLTHERKALRVDSLKKAAHRKRNFHTNGERKEDTRASLLHQELPELWCGGHRGGRLGQSSNPWPSPATTIPNPRMPRCPPSWMPLFEPSAVGSTFLHRRLYLALMCSQQPLAIAVSLVLSLCDPLQAFEVTYYVFHTAPLHLFLH